MFTVYRYYSAQDELLYVGMTNNFERRDNQHRLYRPWFPEVAKVTLQNHEDREEAKEAEKVAIRLESPRHNIYRYDQPPAKEPSEYDPEKGIPSITDLLEYRERVINLWERFLYLGYGSRRRAALELGLNPSRVTFVLKCRYYDLQVCAMLEAWVDKQTLPEGVILPSSRHNDLVIA